MLFFYVIVPLSIFIVAVMIGIAATREAPTMNEQIYRFKLTRVITNGKGDPIVSSHTIEIGTDDPRRTADVIFKNFPTWQYMEVFEGSACEGRR